METAEVERRSESFKAAATEVGVKLTHQRLEIFREIAASVAHPDADTVFQAVRQRMPTVSLDTVYRTLWMLTDLGLISTLGPRRESVRFDANLARHHHYVCTRCGLARDFESAALDALRIPKVVKGFGSVVATHVEVRGVCDSCEKQRAKKSANKDLTRGRARPPYDAATPRPLERGTRHGKTRRTAARLARVGRLRDHYHDTSGSA